MKAHFSAAAFLAFALPGAAMAQQDHQVPMQHGQMVQGQMHVDATEAQQCMQMAHAQMTAGAMQHGQMDQSTLPQGQMEHGQMGHGQMEHAEMSEHSGVADGTTCQGQMMDHGQMMNHGPVQQGQQGDPGGQEHSDHEGHAPD